MFWTLIAGLIGCGLGFFIGFCVGSYFCVKNEVYKDKEFVNKLKQKR